MRGIDTALARVYRENAGRVLAALINQLRDFDLAEEAFQDAMMEAARVWTDKGVPDNTAGWLLTVARRRAIDRLRKSKRAGSNATRDTILLLAEDNTLPEQNHTIPDERLRLIFTCCHPALAQESQVALTLRSMCGLPAAEIARAFLTTEPTMHQRLTRAKSKIRNAGIPYRVPEQPDILPRLQPVLSVIYLIYNAGYTPNNTDLTDEAIRLATILHQLLPHAEVAGLFALMTLHHARNAARFQGGKMVSLEHQNRDFWDQFTIKRGKNILVDALKQNQPGPYQFQAAISAVHSDASDWQSTDWPQIVGLYTALNDLTPSPIIQLNRAVAVANAGDLAKALADLETLKSDLANYQPFYAARAELRCRDGQIDKARQDYQTAIRFSQNTAEQEFLKQKLSELG